MGGKFQIIPVLCLLVLVSQGCGLSINADQPSSQPLTNVINTAVVRSLTETSMAQTVDAISFAQTQIALPSLTPTLFLTSTPDKILLTVSQNTNCRTGPGTVYDSIVTIIPGMTAEVIARDSDGLGWFIRNPNNPEDFCWVSGEFATIKGNSTTLPAFTAMPTPTPLTAGFSVISKEAVQCLGGIETWFNFIILNSGGVAWSSWKLDLTDTAVGEPQKTGGNKFTSGKGCTTLGTQDSITVGGSGGVFSGPINYNPAGHVFTGTLILCNQDGMQGTCLSKTVNITP